MVCLRLLMHVIDYDDNFIVPNSSHLGALQSRKEKKKKSIKNSY